MNDPDPKPIEWDTIPVKQQHMLLAWSEALVMGKAVLIAFLWVAGAVGIVAGAIYYTLASRTEYSRHSALAGMKLKALAMLGLGLGGAFAIAYATEAPALHADQNMPVVRHQSIPFISRDAEMRPVRYINIHYQRAPRRWH